MTLLSCIVDGCYNGGKAPARDQRRKVMAEGKKGGHNRTRCTAITLEGHRCTNPPKDDRDLCWIHLRKINKVPRPDNTDLAKLISNVEASEFDGLDPRHAMNLLASAFLGHMTETKSSGGDGELHEVPLSGKDRIAAANTWLMRYSQFYGEGEANGEDLARSLRDFLNIDPNE